MSKKEIELNGKTILVTGSPGFIGAYVVIRLLQEMNSGTIVSFDNMNDYYDVSLKNHRKKKIEKAVKKSKVKHCFVEGDVANQDMVRRVFKRFRPDIVIHLAAQAGVRYSIENPDEYISSNVMGFYNILEECRYSYDYHSKGVSHLVFASSSSVYGESQKVPFAVEDNVNHPESLYAATKISNELFAYTYSKLYSVPTTGLRFFTVYGPAGRPDMFYYSATEKLANGEKIKVFNNGNMMRDFTYIDDIVEGVVRVAKGAPVTEIREDKSLIPPYAIYNIGGSMPVNLLDFLKTLTEKLKEANVLDKEFVLENRIEMTGMQPGDVSVTYADCSALERDYGFVPKIEIDEGLKRFAEWYKKYAHPERRHLWGKSYR